MPITKSAKKSLKVSEVKRAQNKIQEIALSYAIKKGDEKNVSEIVSLIDKAAKTGIIHKNKAARLKSQLSKKYGTPKKESQKSNLKSQNEKVKIKKKKSKK